MVAESLFIELSAIVIIALIVTIITSLLKQPLIIGYIITGIIASPRFLNVINLTDSITTLAKLGVALLLFMVGLNLNPRTIKEVGKVTIITGILQIAITFSLAFLLAKTLNFSTSASFYIAIALSFSSTIIIMKLLADKGDISNLYGRVSIGILIIQDIVAIGILMIISSLSVTSNLSLTILSAIMKGIGLITILFLIAVYILPFITKVMAKSQELLLLFSIGWCVALASLFYYFNFSIEIGALIAGVTLSLSQYKYEISSRLKPLRDFFLIIFFIILGSQMSITNIKQLIPSILLFSFLILIINPITIMIVMGRLGYTKRNSFLTGITLTQISEFSFIILALAISLNHINTDILSLITITALITIALSSYFIIYSNKIYSRLSGYLSIFEKKGTKIDEGKYYLEKDYDIILLGYNRIGFDLLESFKKIRKNSLVVDYNPNTITQLVKQGQDCRYGDAGDSELLAELNMSKAKMVISTIPDIETNLLIIKKVRESNKKSIIIVISHQIDEALKLYKEGASYVIMPHFLGGHYTSKLIESYGLNVNKFLEEKSLHLEKLKARKKQGHEHPRHERD